MQQPGLEPAECPNYETCGSASQLSPEEEVEIRRVRLLEIENRRQEAERIEEIIRVSRRSAALMMLMQRGNPQSWASLIDFSEIETLLGQLRSRLDEFTQDRYIAPMGCEAHRYNVKRPRGIYWYNKLTSKDAVFQPEVKQNKVKVIHLSHDDDARNIEGRLGVERRNRLRQVNAQIAAAENALRQAIELLQNEI